MNNSNASMNSPQRTPTNKATPPIARPREANVFPRIPRHRSEPIPAKQVRGLADKDVMVCIRHKQGGHNGQFRRDKPDVLSVGVPVVR